MYPPTNTLNGNPNQFEAFGLKSAKLKGARYVPETVRFPVGFDPEKEGMIAVEESDLRNLKNLCYSNFGEIISNKDRKYFIEGSDMKDLKLKDLDLINIDFGKNIDIFKGSYAKNAKIDINTANFTVGEPDQIFGRSDEQKQEFIRRRISEAD